MNYRDDKNETHIKSLCLVIAGAVMAVIGGKKAVPRGEDNGLAAFKTSYDAISRLIMIADSGNDYRT